MFKKEGAAFSDDRTVAQIMDAFVKRGRVRWVTQKAGAGQIVPFEVPKDFPWQAPMSVRNLGLRYKADGVLLLTVDGVVVNISWYSTSDGQPLFYESVSLPEAGAKPGEAEARKKRITDWVAEIWSKIPGQGYVVKRDMSTVSIEGAKALGLKVGDVLELRRLDQVERHPLLKTLTGITSSVTGRAKITTIDEPFSVANIEYESKLDPIQEGDRYQASLAGQATGVGPSATGLAGASGTAAADPAPVARVDEQGRSVLPLFSQVPPSSSASPATDESLLRIVDVGGALTYGRYSVSESVLGDATPKEMSSLSPGFRLDLRAYITRQVLLNSELEYGLVKFGGLTDTYAVDSIGSGWISFRIGAGYRFIFEEHELFPTEIVASLSYRNASLNNAQITSDIAPTSKTYSGYELGLGVGLPLIQQFGAQVHINRSLTASLTETATTGGATTKNTTWEYGAALRYRLNSTSEISGGLNIHSIATNFTGAGTRTTASLSTSFAATVFYAGYWAKF